MEIEDIEKLLDKKLAPIISRLDGLELKFDGLAKDVREILKFVPVGNQDVEEDLHRKRKKVA